MQFEKIQKKLLMLLKESYSKYSGYRVAAICISKKKQKFTGVNVENAVLSLSICAERNSLFAAFSNGVKANEIKEIHILGQDPFAFTFPCGSCRQVMWELMGGSAEIYIYKKDFKTTQNYFHCKVKDLLPHPFLLRGEK